MTLKELKTIVANINATNIRIGGFCHKYNKLHDTLQLKVDEQMKLVEIVNSKFYDNSQPIFNESETKTRILSLPKGYDSYEVLLHGMENTTTHTIRVKSIKKAVRLDDPSNNCNAGLCLLGPLYHLPYRVSIIFADTRSSWEFCKPDPVKSENGYGEVFIYDEFCTEQERENFIEKYADIIDESVGDKIVRL